MLVLVVLFCLALISSGATVPGSKIDDSVDHGPICDVCVATLEAAKSATTSQEIENVISDMANGVCSFSLLKPVRIKCLEITKKIIERHFYIIREFTILFTPRDVCEMIKLCPNEDESNSAESKKLEIVTKHGQVCDVCLDTLTAIKSATTSEEIWKLVTDTATVVCKFTPWFIRPRCQNYLETIIGENFFLIREFTEKFPPEYICETIRFCPKELEAENKVTVCELCVDTLEELRSLITMQEFEQLAEDVTFFACSLIPERVTSDVCKVFYKDMLDRLFNYWKITLNMFSSKVLCRMGFFCF